MDPYAFNDTNEGILNAQSALKSLRAILDVAINDSSNTDDSDIASMDDVEFTAEPQNPADEELMVVDADKVIALREQLEGLEDMLQVVLDARLARDLSGLSVEVDEESMDVLRRVIGIATDVISSEMAYPNDDEENFLRWDETPRSGGRHIRSDAQTARSIGLNIPKPTSGSLTGLEGPLSPLTELSSSDSELEPPDPTCLVCGIDLPPPDRVKMPCGHIYCPECTTHLVQTYITQPFPKGQFRCCPPPKPSISPEDVNQFINTSLLKNLNEKLKEASTPHDQRIYCPQENCKMFIKPERVTPIVKRVGYVKCPNNACNVRICLDCKELIHNGVDCDTYADNSQATVIQRQFGWSRCPGCRFVVEKISGCNEISCGRCGRCFTYVTP